MKKHSIKFQFVIVCLSMLLLTINTVSQTNSTTEKRRKLRYITSTKSDAKVRPQIKIIKRGRIGRKPVKSIRKLVVDKSGLERKTFKLINAKRLEHGLTKLKWSDEIASLARQHSQNMARHTFFSHTGLNGRLIDQRAIDFGIKRWKSIGENIAYNKGFEKPADFAVKRWMISSTHRSNLLDHRWTESGIGIGVTEDGIYYFTQIFILK